MAKSKLDEDIDTVNTALGDYMENSIGEDTPENQESRDVLDGAWERLIQRLKKSAK